MQSVLAVADVHKAHQSDKGHLEFVDDDVFTSVGDDSVTGDAIDINQSSDNLLDCQHCCHCHSPQLNFLSSVRAQPAFMGGNPHFADLSGSVPSSQPVSLYRPPRG